LEVSVTPFSRCMPDLHTIFDLMEWSKIPLR
jgi:hypothetical protein